MFVISGLLWRIGLSVQAAYLVWTPIALLVLIAGYALYAGRFCSGRERAAALALSLLFFSPLVPLLDWGKSVDAGGANQLVITAGQAETYWQAWGYLPTALALGLMPVFLVGVERQLEGSSSRRAVLGTALAGLTVAWLHPWGGIELIAIVVACSSCGGFPAAAPASPSPAQPPRSRSSTTRCSPAPTPSGRCPGSGSASRSAPCGGRCSPHSPLCCWLGCRRCAGHVRYRSRSCCCGRWRCSRSTSCSARIPA